MTAPLPAPPLPTPAQALPPTEEYPQPRSAAENVVLAALAAYVAGSAAAGAAGSAAALIAAMVRLGIPRPAVRAVLTMGLSIGRTVPPVPVGAGKLAQRHTARAEPLYRAAYLLNAAKRLGKAYAHPPAAKPGEAPPSPQEALQHALEVERRHLISHTQATRQRSSAAAAVDTAARTYGPLLSWVAQLDDRTTPDCRKAHGKNFRVTSPPRIGWPGSVHPTCRCRPGPPRDGAPVMTGRATTGGA